MLCNIQRIIPSNYVLVIEIVMRNCMDPSKIELYSRSTRLSAVSVNLRQARETLNRNFSGLSGRLGKTPRMYYNYRILEFYTKWSC